ncbi:MAG TPA: putative glycoside hydrolase [Terriglobales bacterium]|nr:putative glycoside hydrolase [Terriglobales bacterium]
MSSNSRLPLFAVLFFVAIAAILLLKPSEAVVVEAADASKNVTVKSESAATTQQQAAPGTVIHTAKSGDTVPMLVRKYLWDSKYMTSSEFEAAIRQANPTVKGTFLKAGENVVVPGIEPVQSEKLISVPKDYEVRAIYLTGIMAASEKGINIVRQWRKVGGNAVVFDIKDSDGWVNINFDHELVPKGHKPPIKNLAKYTKFLHSMGMHAIARIAIFRDEAIVVQHPELAVKSRRTGQPWQENGKLVWTDVSNQKVQAYNIALAKHAALSGVDEVQFDYVRFPAEGDQKDAKFAFETANPTWKRTDVITDFLKDAYAELHPTGVLFSLDVFGVMAWQRSVDLAHTGQDIPSMAKYCDVLSPMIYPSHFFGMDGYASPGDAPEHFIGTSMDRFRTITKDTNVVLRPWLQAFAWKTKTYSPEYIQVQVATSASKGGVGFLFWNARNDYSKPYAAMPVMAKNQKFFRGDEYDRLPKPAAADPVTNTAQSKFHPSGP